jgi:hypothetical protein
MKLAFLLELVLACALGFALARYEMEGTGPRSGWRDEVLHHVYRFHSFLMGFITVGTVGFYSVLIVKRTRPVWSLGSLAWGVFGLAAVINWTELIVFWVLDDVNSGRGVSLKILRKSACATAWLPTADDLQWLPFPLFVMSILSRTEANNKKLDAREWTGRIMLVIVALTTVSHFVLQVVAVQNP